MQDSPERTALYEKMSRIAAEQVPWVFGVHRQSFIMKHSWLKNYLSSDVGADRAEYVNIDLEKKKKMVEKL